jgi:hypothetical protein
MRQATEDAFRTGMTRASAIAAAVTLLGMLLAWLRLPGLAKGD